MTEINAWMKNAIDVLEIEIGRLRGNMRELETCSEEASPEKADRIQCLDAQVQELQEAVVVLREHAARKKKKYYKELELARGSHDQNE